MYLVIFITNHKSSQMRFPTSISTLLLAFIVSADDTLSRLYKSDHLLNIPTKPTSTRNKRSVSRDHTVELMIVADSKMAEYHGDGLEQYILSLVAVVSIP